MIISHDIDSWMVYVHPPIAVIGYLLTFTLLFSFIMYRKDKGYGSIVKKVGWTAWTFNLLGLLTGMIWAQMAWGRPFAFDPKETFTLLLFLSVGANMYMFHGDRDKKILILVAILSCLLILLTILVPLFLGSLHGYL